MGGGGVHNGGGVAAAATGATAADRAETAAGVGAPESSNAAAAGVKEQIRDGEKQGGLVMQVASLRDQLAQLKQENDQLR